MNLLAADIGGTKSWLCLYQVDHENNQTVIFEQIYSSLDFTNVNHLLDQFLENPKTKNIKISHMYLALPGLVNKRHAKLTNLDWSLDADALQFRYSIETVSFINDFEAAALGISTISEADYTILNIGKSRDKTVKVVTGAGTGLGIAWLNYEKDRYLANASEGEHLDFAPISKQQILLLEFLMKDYSMYPMNDFFLMRV